MNIEKPREIALRILQRREEGDKFIEDLLEEELGRTSLAPIDRRLAQELAYGVVRWQATLDWLVARKTAARPQKPALRILLRLGLYQIFWLDRIPNHAAVHETVELAKRLGFGRQSGFVNALLRGYIREQAQTDQLLAELKTSDPALGFSHPEWLSTRWRERWGREAAAQLLDWNNQPPRTFARLNALRAEPAALISRWRDEGVEYDFVRRDWLEENQMFELKSHPPLATLPSFQAGLFYVQDPSTLLAVRELDPQPGEGVLDLCAAPGGKTAYIAQRMQNRGRIVAEDIDHRRLAWLQENCARLGVEGLEISPPSTHNPAPADSPPPAPFDRILVDAPCSNTGVVRRRVDLRWRLRLAEIQRLRETQLELLRRAVPRLRPQGILVYSTCSLEPEENASVVQEFLSEHSHFQLEHERELVPFRDDVDGAYVARLCRKA